MQYHQPLWFSAKPSIVKVYFAILNYPPAVTVAGYRVRIKVHFPILDMPPAPFSIDCCSDDIILPRLNLPTLTIPPAFTVFYKAIIGKCYFPILDYPKPTCSVNRSADHIIGTKLRFPIFTVPPAIAVLRKAFIRKSCFSRPGLPTSPILHRLFRQLHHLCQTGLFLLCNTTNHYGSLQSLHSQSLLCHPQDTHQPLLLLATVLESKFTFPFWTCHQPHFPSTVPPIISFFPDWTFPSWQYHQPSLFSAKPS